MNSYEIKKSLENKLPKKLFDNLKYFYSMFLKFTRIRTIGKKYFLEKRFKKILGRKLSFENPKTFNEKLQYRKIYDKKEIYVLCSDKYKVRKYVKKSIGKKYLIPLLYVTENPKEINFDNLPKSFVIKSNHATGHKIFVRNKKEIDKKKIIKTLRRWLNINYYYTSLEWQYKNIKPKIVIEKLMLDNGRVPTDYKIHCFDGKAKYIQAINGRDSKITKESSYDTRWKKQKFTFTYKKHNKALKKPKNLKEMIKIAEKLSTGFDYVRVDLYSIKNKIFFGEFTFTPDSGFLKINPPEWDYRLGKLWKLNKK